MKTRLLLAATLAALALPAVADTINLPPLEPTCIAPLLWHTNRCECPDGQTPTETSYATFVCPAPPSPARTACSATISYAIAAPTAPVLVRDSSPACDDAALDRAIAIILARRLGAP